MGGAVVMIPYTQIPIGYIQIQSSAGNPVDPQEQAQDIAQNRASVAALNAINLAAFQGQCGQWTARNLHYRDLGMSLDSKPAQPAEMKLDVIADASGSGAVWVGTVPSGSVLGSPCPDLPGLISNTLPPNTPNIGVLDYSTPTEQVYQCQPGDSLPAGAVLTVKPGNAWVVRRSASDATPLNAGVGFASGATPPPGDYSVSKYPFGGWYFKVA